MRVRPADVALGILTALKWTALTALLGLLVGRAVSGTRDDEPLAKPYQHSLQDQLTAHHCRAGALPHDAVPGSALILMPSGQPRLVSYDRGVSVYEDRAPGTLVAFCADRLPSR